jgi:hypothetical protein
MELAGVNTEAVLRATLVEHCAENGIKTSEKAHLEATNVSFGVNQNCGSVSKNILAIKKLSTGCRVRLACQ